MKFNTLPISMNSRFMMPPNDPIHFLDHPKDPLYCTLLASLSLSIENVIEILIYDDNTWLSMEYSKSREIFIAIESIFNDNRKELRKKTKNSLYRCACSESWNAKIFYNAFTIFTQEIERLNKNYAQTISEVITSTKTRAYEHEIEKAINLAQLCSKISNKFTNKTKEKYEKYSASVDLALKKLKQEFLITKVNELKDRAGGQRDKYLNYAKFIQSNISPVDIDSGITIFYVDQNFVSSYISNESLRKQVLDFKNKTGCIFTSSIYLIQDGLNMNRLLVHDYLTHLAELTDSLLYIKTSTGDLSLCRINIEHLAAALLNIRHYSTATEDVKYYSVLLKYIDPIIKRRSKAYEALNEDLVDFLNEIINCSNNNGALDSLNRFLKEIGSTLTVSDIANKKITVNSEAQTASIIDNCIQLFDIIGYKMEGLSDRKKLKNSFRDGQHLMSSWKSTYLVSEDDKLMCRGNFIFQLLGLKTKIINKKILTNNIFREFHQQQNESNTN